MENNIPEENLEKEEFTKVEYFQPKFWHRIMANFVDIFIFGLSFLGMFIGLRAIVQSTPAYKNNSEAIYNLRIQSGIYVSAPTATGESVDLIKYLEEQESVYGHQFIVELNEDGTPTEELLGRNGKCDFAIKTFIRFCKTECNEDRYNDLLDYYRNDRLSATYNEIHLFVLDNDEVVANESFANNPQNYKYYFSNFFKPFIEKKCLPFLATNVTEYRLLVRNDYISLLAIELPIAYTLAAIHTYFIPPLFFKRGRKTLGKALYHIGLVDSRVLSPTVPRYLVRFAIFFFGELVLSLASFGIPYLISFSLMAFSKNKQGFPDYMLKLIEIDTSRSNIYMNYVEASLQNEIHQKAIDFRPIKPL